MDFKLFEGLVSKIRLMVGRALISAIRYDGAIHRAQLRLLADEIQDDVELMQHYGLASAPKPGAEAAVVFLGGNRDHGIIVATHDRRYRLSLEEGEVALHDDLGQFVHLKRTGISVSSPTEIKATAPVVRVIAASEIQYEAPIITLNAAEMVLVDAPFFACTGAIKDGVSVAGVGGVSMGDMRDVYNAHHHNENNVLAGPTTTPDQVM